MSEDRKNAIKQISVIISQTEKQVEAARCAAIEAEQRLRRLEEKLTALLSGEPVDPTRIPLTELDDYFNDDWQQPQWSQH